jgi:hypothetical protein
MDGNMLIAIFSFAGTAIGTIGGILAANKLVNFRLKALEDKVDKHNCLVERMVEVEQRSKSNTHRLDRVEKIKCDD